MGPHRRPQPRPAVRRRAAVRPRRRRQASARARAQPGRPHARPRTQRRQVDLLDAQTLRRRRSLRALRGFAAAVAYSPDGHLLAVAGQRGQVTLWDARTLRPAGELSGLRTTVQALAFSPDDRRARRRRARHRSDPGRPSSITGASVRVWDVRRRAPTRVRFALRRPRSPSAPTARCSPPPRSRRPTEVRDARTGRLVATLPTPDCGRSLAFSPDGALLATGHYDGTGQLWSTKTWKPVGRPLEGHDERAVPLDGVHPRRPMLATAGQDGTVRAAGRRDAEPDRTVPAGRARQLPRRRPVARRLATVRSLRPARRAVRWDIAPEAWKRHACRVAGRELTHAEWADALPGQPYRTVCQPG